MIGQHCIWDVYQADGDQLSFVPQVEATLHALVNELKLSKVSSAFKQFHPVGVTGFILLEESHVSIHTWPERNFAAIDIFSCQPFEADKITSLLSRLFNTMEIDCRQWDRGDHARAQLKAS